MPLKAIVLKNDLTYDEVKIRAEPGEAIINKGLYVVGPGFVQLRKMKGDSGLLGGEIFFYESNSNPIPLKKPGSKYEDPSKGYLDDMIYKNALEQTGDPAILGLVSGLVAALKPLLEPAQLFKILFLGLIAWSLIRSLLGL